MSELCLSEEQIGSVLRKQEVGAMTAVGYRSHGIGEQAFYSWKSSYGGVGPLNVQRMKTQEGENRRLKRLLAEQVLNSAALKVLPAEN